MQRRAFVGSTLAALALPLPALPHRLRYGLTSVVWNARTDVLEITHRLHVHDVLRALVEHYDLRNPDLTDVRTLAQATLYTSSRFALIGEGIGRLTNVGAELAGEFVLIFQEAAVVSLPNRVRVRARMLMELFPDQRNQVNLHVNGVSRTVVFGQEDLERGVELGSSLG